MFQALRRRYRLIVDEIRRSIREGTFPQLVEWQLEVRPYLKRVPYWVAAGAVGGCAVLYSYLFNGAIGVARWVEDHHPYYLFALSPICLALAYLVVKRLAPAAGGTGTPQVMRALSLDSTTHASEIDTILRLRVAVVVALSSLLAALGGGALGREGPMIHIAACVFYFTGRQLHRIWPYVEHRSWIVAGGAAGVAAAFNAPLAGVVFVLEELAQQQFHKFKTVVLTSAILGGVVAQWLSGRYLFLGYPPIGSVPLSSLPWALGLGVLCGVCSIPFKRFLEPEFRTRYFSRLGTGVGFAVFAGLCVAAIAVFIDRDSIGGGTLVLERLMFEADHQASWGLVISRFLATIVTALVGCSGGLLAPSLAMGAALGSKFAVLTNYPNHNLLVMVGMSAFLSCIIRAPFTAWVVVMEMTDRHSTIFPLMVASLASWGTVKFIEEREARKRGAPLASDQS